MCRHRGIGMNRPKKKKVSVPSLPEVKLLLRGYAPEPTREPDLQRPEPLARDAPPSPGAVLVMELKRFAAVKKLEAWRARDAFANVMAQHAGRKRLNEACWRALDTARPSWVVHGVGKARAENAKADRSKKRGSKAI